MSEEKTRIEQYLEFINKNNASDLHLKSGYRPYARKLGKLYPIDKKVLCDEDIIEFHNKYCNKQISIDNTKITVDFAFEYDGSRFRVNTYHDHNGYCASIRLLKLFSTDFNVLGLPQNIETLVNRPNGLLLITGPTGSGKSTTLAALINYLNNTVNKHIVTIEDPIEYTFDAKRSLITQREIGTDADEYNRTIMDTMRQDPDIIVIGEIRDASSLEAALAAAETGHLVLATLHTKNAVSTITRIVDLFTTDKQNLVLNQLSTALIGILSQQLLPTVSGDRLQLATELMVNNAAISSNIKQNKTQMIENMIELGKNDGMYLMNQSINDLYKKEIISLETATQYQIY